MSDFHLKYAAACAEVEKVRAERDAALKAKEEAEIAYSQMFDREAESAGKAALLERELASLRAHLAEVREAKERSDRECSRLLRELIDLHLEGVQPVPSIEAADAILRRHGVDPAEFMQRAREHVSSVRAALSSPASSGVEREEEP